MGLLCKESVWNAGPTFFSCSPFGVRLWPSQVRAEPLHACSNATLSGCLNWVVGIAMSEVQRATAGASTSMAKAARSGGVPFVRRFGATLNAHVHLHLHLCMLDGVVAPGR